MLDLCSTRVVVCSVTFCYSVRENSIASCYRVLRCGMLMFNTSMRKEKEAHCQLLQSAACLCPWHGVNQKHCRRINYRILSQPPSHDAPRDQIPCKKLSLRLLQSASLWHVESHRKSESLICSCLPHVLLLLFAGRACAQVRRRGVTGIVPRNWTELVLHSEAWREESGERR